jgi:hypothetical protein
LPAAWVGATVSSSVWLNGRGVDSEDIGFLGNVLSHAIWGAVFVWIGQWIVPSGKIFVIVLLAGLSFVNFGFPAIISILSNSWLELVAPVVAISSSVGCAVHLINEMLSQKIIPELQQPAPTTPSISPPSKQNSLPEFPKTQMPSELKSRLCTCAVSSPVDQYRNWPGTEDSVLFTFCKICKKPITDY